MGSRRIFHTLERGLRERAIAFVWLAAVSPHHTANRARSTRGGEGPFRAVEMIYRMKMEIIIRMIEVM